MKPGARRTAPGSLGAAALRCAVAGLILLAAAGATLLACASEPPAPLPEGAAALEALAARKPSGEPLAEDVVVVPRFELEGPFPERAGALPAAPTGPFADLFAAEVERSRGALLATQGMECVAREVARFFLQHGGLPDEAVQRFVAGRCGSIESAFRFGWLSGGLPAGQSETALAAAWRSQAQELLRAVPAGPASAGLAFERQGDSGVLLLAVGARGLRLEPAATQLDAEDSVELRGSLDFDADALSAWIGSEELGAVPCELRRDVPLPAFAVRCAAPAAARWTWVSVLARRRGQILSDSVLNLVVRPAGDDARRFERPSIGRPAAAAEGEDEAVRFLELLNAVRSEAGLRPLALAPEQSDLARRAAPHYFLAASGQPPKGSDAAATRDLVAVGLMQGSRLGVFVARSSFAAFAARGTDDLSRLLGEALELPAGRILLLDPAGDRIAVGIARAGKGKARGFIALLAVYETPARAPGGI